MTRKPRIRTASDGDDQDDRVDGHDGSDPSVQAVVRAAEHPAAGDDADDQRAPQDRQVESEQCQHRARCLTGRFRAAAEDQPAEAERRSGRRATTSNQVSASSGIATPSGARRLVVPAHRGDAGDGARPARSVRAGAHAPRAGTRWPGRRGSASRLSGSRAKRTSTPGQLGLAHHRLGLRLERVDEGFALAERAVADPAGSSAAASPIRNFSQRGMILSLSPRSAPLAARRAVSPRSRAISRQPMSRRQKPVGKVDRVDRRIGRALRRRDGLAARR